LQDREEKLYCIRIKMSTRKGSYVIQNFLQGPSRTVRSIR